VHEAVLARETSTKHPNSLIVTTLAAINFAHFDFRHHALDGFGGNLHAFGGDGVNLHRTVIFDVNLTTRLIDDAFDIFAAGPINIANSPGLIFSVMMRGGGICSISGRGAGRVSRIFFKIARRATRAFSTASAINWCGKPGS